jgi:hypothetical protein
MEKDLRTIIVFGLRYALPRHTYSFWSLIKYYMG